MLNLLVIVGRRLTRLCADESFTSFMSGVHAEIKKSLEVLSSEVLRFQLGKRVALPIIQ